MSQIRDQYAEMYVAGILADAGWNIYFPRRDKGFDMMATKLVNNQIIIKPIQVKGLYPSKTKKDKRAYGYTGKLTQTHSDMILALVYFSPTEIKNPYEAPIHIAWMTRENIKPVKKGFNCPPAQIKSGKIVPRRDFRKFFDEDGLKRVERLSG